jgi:predicted nucleic acid-binding Zn ribbon protein
MHCSQALPAGKTNCSEHMSLDSSNDLEPPRRTRQFTIRALLFATTLVAVAAACFGGLIRAGQDDLPTTAVLFVIAAPLALMFVLSLAGTIERLIGLWRKRRKGNSDV